MERGVRILATATAALFVTALAALPQNYTISAKPGVVNYIEGTAYLNGNKLSEQAARTTFLAAGDHLSTDAGKAEVLLTPGVFLRIGDNSEIHMISPTLTNTQLEVVRGEAIIEAAGLLKDNNIQVTDHGASIVIEKNGLYRFKADDPPSAAVLEGKESVFLGDKKIELSKDRETILSDVLKAQKFDPKQEDELYAWSNVRSEYEAAASYQSAQAASVSSYGGGWGNYGFGGMYGPGWFWNSAFNSYAWLPAYGAFYSPFGWGFYSPGVVGYAPIVTGPVYRGGHWDHSGNWAHNGHPNNPNWKGHHWTGTSTNAAVPVRTDRPPAVGVVASSPWAAHEARVQAARSLASTGAFTPGAVRGSGFAGGSHVSGPSAVAVRGGGGWSGGGAAGHPAGGWSGGGHAGGWSGGAAHAGGGGWSGGGGHAGNFSGGGGGHAGGGGGGGGGHAGGGGGGGGHH